MFHLNIALYKLYCIIVYKKSKNIIQKKLYMMKDLRIIMQYNVYSMSWTNDYYLDGGLKSPFALLSMSYEDHSPSTPVLNYREYELIHGRRPYYDPRIITSGNDGEFWRELNSFFPDLSEPEKEIIMRDAKKVYGALPVKLAVSLYAHGYPVEKILQYLKRKGIEMTAHRLYSLCYQNGLKKVRREEVVPFGWGLPPDVSAKLFNLSKEKRDALEKEYYEEYAKALHDPSFMGKKKLTVARLVMKRVLRRWGLA